MYSAWNTNGNAIGLGVAHSQVIAIAKETSKRPAEMLSSQLRVLIQHIIEDGIYTKSGKLSLNNKGYRPNVQDRINSQVLYNLIDTKKVTDVFVGKVFKFNDEEFVVDNASIDTLKFPWGRTFDIYVGVSTDISKVKS